MNERADAGTPGPIVTMRAVGVVPVIVIEDASKAVELAGALIDGGLPCAEVTFRTAAAAESIARIREAHPDMLVGAGTVTGAAQARAAQKAGAMFAVSPGLNPRTADECAGLGLPFYPGVCTPTDVELALERGLPILKFFPAGPTGGLPYLRAIAAPFPDVSFIPTGGIREADLDDYLAWPRVLACGGSWLAPREWIEAGAWDRVRETAARAVARVRAVREPAAESVGRQA